MTCAAVALDNWTNTQTPSSLRAAEQAAGLQQQPEHARGRSEIVGLGESMQARERVEEAKQPDAARQEEEGAGGDRDNREDGPPRSWIVVLPGRGAVHERH